MKTLARFVWILSVFALASTLATAQTTPPKKRQPRLPANQADFPLVKFSIELSALSTAAGVGEEMEVEVRITNTDDYDILYSDPREFFLEVRDRLGNEVAHTPYGLTTTYGLTTSISVFAAPIRPGTSLERSALLNKEFKLDKPGDYTVQAVRQNSLSTFIKSNVVAITITP
jgi:hypothetical protein